MLPNFPVKGHSNARSLHRPRGPGGKRRGA